MIPYKNMKLDPAHYPEWRDHLNAIRDMVEQHDGQQLACYVITFWFTDTSFCVVPVGPDDMTPDEALTLVKGAALLVEDSEQFGTWRKARIDR